MLQFDVCYKAIDQNFDCGGILRLDSLARECNALWGEPERVIEVCCRFSSTVEDGALSLSL